MTYDFEQIKDYWERRAAADTSVQSTTQDFYLREIEFRVLKRLLQEIQPSMVADVGCGDARTTIRLAQEFPGMEFWGGDYAISMVRNAIENVQHIGVKNLTIAVCDVLNPLSKRFALIFTTRCLINLPSWEDQKKALANLREALLPGGSYILIENFVEGQENFNRVRAEFGLPPIAIRPHNCFFSLDQLRAYCQRMFEIVEDVNVSSTYYLASRVIYSKICHEKNLTPDYLDDHHRLAAALPFAGEFGPVRMLWLRRI